jgi:hypothetical protein
MKNTSKAPDGGGHLPRKTRDRSYLRVPTAVAEKRVPRLRLVPLKARTASEDCHPERQVGLIFPGISGRTRGSGTGNPHAAPSDCRLRVFPSYPAPRSPLRAAAPGVDVSAASPPEIGSVPELRLAAERGAPRRAPSFSVTSCWQELSRWCWPWTHCRPSRWP